MKNIQNQQTLRGLCIHGSCNFTQMAAFCNKSLLQYVQHKVIESDAVKLVKRAVNKSVLCFHLI